MKYNWSDKILGQGSWSVDKMNEFGHTTAKIAAWNLAGFLPISLDRLEAQVEGLAILDAEVVTLVEVKPFDHMQRLIDGLAAMGCEYDSVMLPQASGLNIGVLFKKGVEAMNPRFIDNSDLGDPSKRKAMVVDMKIGKFDFRAPRKMTRLA